MEEELFEIIGSFGRWQKVIFALFFYHNTVTVGQNFAMTFLAPNVPFRCIVPSFNNSKNIDDLWPNDCTAHLPNSSEDIPCTRWKYDTERYSDTLVNQFDLVCNREWLISFAKSVYMIGFMTSVFVFGQISDWLGRRPAILICFAITCCSLIASLFSKSIEVFLIFRFFQALGRTGVTTIGFVLIMELVGPKQRSFISILTQLGWCCSVFVFLAFGYFFRDWFWFQVAIALPLLPLVFVFRLIPESPRWLLMHGKSKRLEKLIVYASKTNQIDLKNDAHEIVKKLLKGRTSERKGTLLDLFRTPKMRCRTLNTMYLWFVNAYLYFALSFNTNDFFGDSYVNFLLLAVLEFSACGMLLLTMRWFRRKAIIIVFMFLAGASCLALTAVPNDLSWLSTVFAQAGKFFVTASYGLLYLYTGEMFPTVVRSAALGSCSTVARIGSITAPFSRELEKATHVFVPNIMYCILAVTSGVFTFCLPETAGRKLPDTLDEGENTFDVKFEKESKNNGEKNEEHRF